MPRLDYKTCRECGKHTNEVGLLSHTRLCLACAKRLSAANYDQVQARSGPFFQRWRARTAASIGAVLLDDARDTP
jgi:hypothetical protein